MQGDIIFYEGASWVDKLIQAWTKSRFSHVAIDVGGGMQVEAADKGITMRPLSLANATVWSYAEHSKDVDQKDMDEAVARLKRLVDMHLDYGYSDFFTNANMFRKAFYVVSPLHYDCSALAISFLMQAGGVDLCGLDEDPHLVTPASLANCLGVK